MTGDLSEFLSDFEVFVICLCIVLRRLFEERRLLAIDVVVVEDVHHGNGLTSLDATRTSPWNSLRQRIGIRNEGLKHGKKLLLQKGPNSRAAVTI